jgi:hypothetical protein
VEIRVEYDLQRMLEENRKADRQAFAQALERERENIRHEVEESLPRIDTVVRYTGGRLEVLGRGEIYSITAYERVDLKPEARKPEIRKTEASPRPSLREREKNLAASYSHSRSLSPRESWGEPSPRFGIKTNLLPLSGFARGIDYTSPLPNLSLEYFFARHFSVESGVEYSNWTYNKGKEFQGLTGYRIEPRYWFHDSSFSWFYVGAYGQAGDFNRRTLKVDSNNDTYNHTGKYYEAGLSGGCYIPLSSHWGLDIGVRGGYRHDKGSVYEIKDGVNSLLYDRVERQLRLTAVVLSLGYRF